MVRNHTLQSVVALAYPKEGWKMLVYPDASDLYWICFLAQVSPEDFNNGRAVEDMHHEPQVFLRAQVKRAQLRWPTMDKEY